MLGCNIRIFILHWSLSYACAPLFYWEIVKLVCFSLWSYYILQIIEEDKGSGCYVFRKWGRVGNEKIGGNKIELMSSKPAAIQEFKRLFLEKTGNSWEAWEGKSNFQKQPGRFFPLDIVLLFCIYLCWNRLGFPTIKASYWGLYLLLFYW